MSMLAPPPQPPPPAPLPPSESQIRSWQMWCHLSALAGFFVPFGNVLGPLIIWQTKKNEIPTLEAHGKAAVNFQLTALLAAVIAFIVGFPLVFVFCIGFLIWPLGVLILVAAKIFAIIAGIQANDGKTFQYPCSFTFFK